MRGTAKIFHYQCGKGKKTTPGPVRKSNSSGQLPDAKRRAETGLTCFGDQGGGETLKNIPTEKKRVESAILQQDYIKEHFRKSCEAEKERGGMGS